jgi:hypothetical protein
MKKEAISKIAKLRAVIQLIRWFPEYQKIKQKILAPARQIEIK